MPGMIDTSTLVSTRVGGRTRGTTFMDGASDQNWCLATGVADVESVTVAGWDEDVVLVISDETSRAERALAGHLTMIESLDGWQRVPADHSHPQLLSEPDD